MGMHTGKPRGNFSYMMGICEKFISELLSGLHSCCIWIEAGVIFDEDRFLRLKNLRAKGRYPPLIQESNAETHRYSLSLDYFDLVLKHSFELKDSALTLAA